MSGPFHVGEQWVQNRAGVRDKAEQIGSRMIRSVMPEQHREFFLRGCRRFCWLRSTAKGNLMRR